MNSNMICRVGIAGVVASGVGWVVTAPSIGIAQSQAAQYAWNDGVYRDPEKSMTAEEARRLEVERLLTPLGGPVEVVDPEAVVTRVVPKVRIRNPFFEFNPLLDVEVEAEKSTSKRPVAKQQRAVKRTVARPATGYRTSTLSPAWRKLRGLKSTGLFSPSGHRLTTSRFSGGRRAYMSSRWAGLFSDRPQ